MQSLKCYREKGGKGQHNWITNNGYRPVIRRRVETGSMGDTPNARKVLDTLDVGGISAVKVYATLHAEPWI